VKEWRGVKVPGHVDDVLAFVKPLPGNNIATATNKFQNVLHWLWQNGAASYPQPCCGNLPNYAVNLYKL